MKEFVCIVCPNGCTLRVSEENSQITVSGNTCKRGEKFAIVEVTNPTRSLTSTLKTKEPLRGVLPVRTDGEIPKGMISEAMKKLAITVIDKPYRVGDVVIKDFMGTNVNLIATSSLLAEIN